MAAINNSSSTDSAATTATELWRQVIERFRGNMPRGRRRVRMRHYDDCFSGYEAAEWLLHDLQASGLFGTVVRDQAVTLLNKFVLSDVIESVRETKEMRGFEDGPRLYRFVTIPGPFNFLDDEELGVAPDEEGVAADQCIANTHATSFTSSTDDTPTPAGAGAVRPRLAELHTNTLTTPTPSSASKILTTPTDHEVSAVWRVVTLSRLRAVPGLPRELVNATSAATAGGQSATPTEHDLPSWVIMAFKCLSKWPGGNDRPSPYPGFGSDVMEALTAYFTTLPHPMVDSRLYQLHMATLGLIRGSSEQSARAVAILQLASLLMVQSNRVKLHRTLRFISKTSSNTSLTLSSRQSNRDMLLEALAPAILRSPDHSDQQLSAPGDCSDMVSSCSDVVWFMAQHYHTIFTVPCDIKREVESRRSVSELPKAESLHCCPVRREPVYCQRVSAQQYSAQASSHDEIAQLLDTIASNENMSSKTRKRHLKQFKKVYPEVYAAKYPSTTSLSKKH